MRLAARTAALLIAMVVSGCGGQAPSSPPPPSDSPTPLADASLSPEIADAIRFRTGSGLRADLAYVLAVASDPRASSFEWGVPLLPDELAEIAARIANADAIRDAIRTYGERHSSEFAGMYIDQQNGGAVTSMWTANLAVHEAAIRKLVAPGARWAVVGAIYTYSELRALQARIDNDYTWMEPLRIKPMGWGVDIVANTVSLEVSSADPNAEAIVLAHYEVEVGMLIVTSDGTGRMFLPSGEVRGRVLDVAGMPPGEAVAGTLMIDATGPGPGWCGGGDIGYGVAPDGSFGYPCRAGQYTIQIKHNVADGAWETIVEGDVVVLGNDVITLNLRLLGPWPLPPPG